MLIELGEICSQYEDGVTRIMLGSMSDDVIEAPGNVVHPRSLI